MDAFKAILPHIFFGIINWVGAIYFSYYAYENNDISQANLAIVWIMNAVIAHHGYTKEITDKDKKASILLVIIYLILALIPFQTATKPVIELVA